MNTILLSDYNQSLGILIDIEDPFTYNDWHDSRAINIPFNKLIYNFNTLLDKNKKYYIYCRGGVKSRRAVSTLNIYGYNAIQVIIDKK